MQVGSFHPIPEGQMDKKGGCLMVPRSGQGDLLWLRPTSLSGCALSVL